MTWRVKITHIGVVLLALACFNFLGRNLYLMLLASAVITFGSHTKQGGISLKVDSVSVLMIVWVLSYVFWIGVNYSFFSVGQMLVPLTYMLAFTAGRTVITKQTNNCLTTWKTYFFVITLAAAAHGLINMGLNIQTYGFNFSTRVLKDLWASEDILATGQSALFVPLVGCLFYFIMQERKWERWCGIIIILLAVIYNIMSASRFILYISFVALLVSIIYYAFRKRSVQRYRVLFSSIAISLFLFILYRNNVFGVRWFFETSALASRINNLTTAGTDTAFSSHYRSQQMTDIINNFSLYIWGGDPKGYGFVHNTWLSMLIRYGIILALPFALLTIVNAFQVLRLIRKIPVKDSILFLGFYLTMFSYMYIEPMFEGARWLAFAYMFIIGMTSNLVSYVKEVE